MEEYEGVLLVKQEVYVYKIPPRSTNRGYRAADWNLATPDWTGRMRLVTKGKECVMKLEDKVTGELFAKCPIETYPGLAVEAVMDSSRYFVVRIQDDNGRAAFIGLGFSDRSDSFDLNVALQDHFKWLKKEEEIEKEKEEPKPQLDLSFKEGQTIKINMKITKKDGSEVTAKPKSKVPSLGGGILPPPPGGIKIAPPPKLTPTSSPTHLPGTARPGAGGSSDLLGDFGSGGGKGGGGEQQWGDFASAKEGAATAASASSNPNWVQF